MATKTVKRRIFSGAVCEQLVYMVSQYGKRTSSPERQPKARFPDAESYETFRIECSRRNHNRRFNYNFRAGDLYCTLTFDNDWEIHRFDDAKRIRRNFVSVIRRAYPEAVVFLYMGRGKGTARIHFHMVCRGVPKEFIEKKWKYGSVTRVTPLREHNYYDGIDYGQDFTGLANYLFDHWTKEVGGHRWYQTRTAKPPEQEDPTDVRVAGGYSENRPPAAPKGYRLVESRATKYGYLYYKYVLIPPKDNRRSKKKNLADGQMG